MRSGRAYMQDSFRSMPQAQYGLTDPKSLAEYLNHANIRLVRAECSPENVSC